MYNFQFSIKLVLLLFTFYILHFTFYITPVLASDNDIGYSRISPDSPLYFLKGIREVLEMKLALTNRVKLLRELEFATRRLREARTLAAKNEDLIPPTLERYIVYLNALPDKDLTDKEVEDRIRESLAVHLEVLQQMYEKVSSARAKMFIRSDLNRIIQRADVVNSSKAPICQLFAKEASSSTLNQTERVVLAQRAGQCQLLKN